MRTRAVFVGCLFFAIGLTVNAEKRSQPKINWQTEYAKAQTLREKEKRPMLVFVSSHECAYCKKMELRCFSNPHVVREVSNGFVPTYVNATVQKRLTKAFKVTAFPTTFVVAPNNRIIDRIDGYMDAAKFVDRIRQAKNRLRVAKRDHASAATH